MLLALGNTSNKLQHKNVIEVRWCYREFHLNNSKVHILAFSIIFQKWIYFNMPEVPSSSPIPIVDSPNLWSDQRHFVAVSPFSVMSLDWMGEVVTWRMQAWVKVRGPSMESCACCARWGWWRNGPGTKITQKNWYWFCKYDEAWCTQVWWCMMYDELWWNTTEDVQRKFDGIKSHVCST